MSTFQEAAMRDQNQEVIYTVLLKWVEWSEADGVYLGKCPDLITGIHGDDPVQLYAELCEVVEEVIQHFQDEGRGLPEPRIRPMQEVG